MRSVQTLPGIAVNDVFQSSYSVRGGSFQNNGVVLDGVLTHNLEHTIEGTQEPTGSIMLMNGDLQGKLVYDLSPAQRLGASFVWGKTSLTRDPANRGVTSLIEGGNNVGVG